MEVDKWTGEEKISVNEIINMLNEITKIDPEYMRLLITTRIECNQGLMSHKTFQVLVEKETASASFLGLFNGLIGVDRNDWGPITVELDDNFNIKEFKLTKTF